MNEISANDQRRYPRGAPILGLAITIAVTASALFSPVANPASSAAQGSANFEQEWSKLIAAAKQEGTLAIASGGAPSRQYRPVVDAFQKKFGVKAEVSTGSATDTVNRVLAERKGRVADSVRADAHASRGDRHVQVVSGQACVRR